MDLPAPTAGRTLELTIPDDAWVDNGDTYRAQVTVNGWSFHATAIPVRYDGPYQEALHRDAEQILDDLTFAVGYSRFETQVVRGQECVVFLAPHAKG